MAATSAATVMMKPAEAARAPEGHEHRTGVRQLRILSTIWRIEVSRPPGVSMRRIRSGACAASAFFDGLGDVGGGDRMDDAVELDHGDVGLNGRRRRERAREGRRPQGDPHG